MNTVVAAASHLSQEYVTTKILTVLGDGDKAEEVLQQMDADDQNRMLGDDWDGDTRPEPRNGTPDASGAEGGQE